MIDVHKATKDAKTTKDALVNAFLQRNLYDLERDKVMFEKINDGNEEERAQILDCINKAMEDKA